LTGFLYLYTILFSTSNSVNSFRLRVPGALSTAQTYGIGLGIGLTYAGVLWVGWVLGASGNFLISFSLVALYAYLLADNFYLMFVPRHHLTLRDHLRVAGLGWGILVGSLPVAWYVVDQEMSVLVRAIAGLMTIYMLTIISAGVESAFIAKKRDARIGTLTGGILSLALGIGLMVACIEYLKTTAFATLVTDLHRWIMDNIVDQGWVIDLGDLLDLQDKQNVADLSAVMIVITLYLGVALGGSWVLGQALKSLLAQGTATRNTQRTFVFYKLSTFLMTPVELILLPIQNRMGNNPMAYFFILPNMLVFGVFILMPMILNFFFGFTESRSFLPINRWADSGGQIQTQNLQDILTCKNYADPITCEEDLFWRSVRNTFFYVNFQVVSMVLLALITALALNRNIILRGFFRSIFFYPVLLSPVVVAYIWIWILDFDSGLINSLLENLGRDRILFLGNPRNKFWSQLWVIVVADWAFMGFYTLILLAGLQSIPAALYEAAQIDGASSWGQFRHITLPLLMPTMTVVLVLSLIRAVQVFDQVFVLTGGGPGTATHYLVQYIYRSAFEASPPDYGLASSASLLLGIVLFIATMTQLFLARRTEAA
jgi:alpha-1,4-digalacturonate transport system permease protein